MTYNKNFECVVQIGDNSQQMVQSTQATLAGTDAKITYSYDRNGLYNFFDSRDCALILSPSAQFFGSRAILHHDVVGGTLQQIYPKMSCS